MLKQRIITALVLAPIAIACIFFLPPVGFALFIGFVITVGAWEWGDLASLPGTGRYLYAALVALLMLGAWFLPPLPVLVLGALWWCLAFVLVLRYPGGTDLWGGSWQIALFGLFNLVPGFVALLVLKQNLDANFLILLLFFLIWGADVGAYFSGRALGKHKLAIHVSPGKTWEGLAGGLLVAVGIAAGMLLWLGKPEPLSADWLGFLAACSVIVLVSALGDLAISMFKRQRGIKDSSNLLPGHGGVLDRIDSLLSAGPTFALFILLMGWR